MSRRKTPRNRLSVEIYDSGTTLLNDPDRTAKMAVIEGFRKQYPGGICADGSLYVPRPVLRGWLVKGAQRVVFRNGSDVAYEGWISDLDFTIGEAEQGVSVPLVNGIDQFLENWTWRKFWADQRIDESRWKHSTSAAASEKITIDRTERLRITPKAVAWSSDEAASLSYLNITGETIKKVTYDYALAGANFNINWYDLTNGEVVIASSPGSASDQTYTPATPIPGNLAFRLKATAAVTPAADGTVYGQISNVTVYSDSDAITMETIAKGVRFKCTDVSTDTEYISPAGTARTLGSYVVAGHESMADILAEVTSFGDGASPPNRWAWGLYHSEKADAPSGKPVLFIEQYPSTTDYDYIVRLGDKNLVSDVEIDRDYGAVRNWIPVRYTDANGWEQWLTPDDVSALTDTDSISKYGQRALSGGLDAGQVSDTDAVGYGVRYLNTYKAPPWKLLRPLVVQGYILDKQGVEVAASLIDAGKRVKIEGWPEDETGEGITFVITGTDYRPADETCALATGGLMAPFLPRQLTSPASAAGTAGVLSEEGGSVLEEMEELSFGGGGGKDRLNFYKTKLWKKALKLGFASEKDFKKLSAKEKKALKKRVRRKMG